MSMRRLQESMPRCLRHTSLFTIPLAVSLAITACSDIGVSPTSTTVRFVNAIPGASPIGFTSNIGFPVNNIEFEGYSQCTTLTAGTTTFTFGGNGSDVPPTTMTPVTLFGGGKYTIIATGNSAAPSFLFLPDTFTAPPVGSATLRVVNDIPNAGTVDIYVDAPNTVALVNPSATGIPVGGVAYITVSAQQALQVWLTTTQTTTIEATTTTPLNFPSGDEETLFFFGSSGGSTALSFTIPHCP
jgi:hypothetical protein